MVDSYLHDFSTQIAAWAQALIADGRYPFRRAEICPHLLVPAPTSRPPLVFWINRDSFMAGGVILFGDHVPSDMRAQGQSVAAALGIPHYVVWGSHDVTIWNCRTSEPTVHKQLPVNPSVSSAPGDFQTVLLQVLLELRLLCVTEIIAPANLSSAYFANLFIATATATTPLIDREFRLRQADGPVEKHPLANLAAEQKAFLFLLRLVALVAFDRLSPSIHTDGLEQASRYALETLPQDARQALASQPNEPSLGSEAVIRFHHLFRRITQLDISRDHERIAQALVLLLPSLNARFNGFPLPDSHRDRPGSLLLVNPDQPSAGTIAAEIASQPLLTIFTLIRALRKTPAPLQQSTSVMSIKAEAKPDSILGTLSDPSIPTGRERSALTTLLRNSWPGRRWSFPVATPRWVWEFIHLTGIATSDTLIELTVPHGWLVAPFASTLLELFCSDFTIVRVAERGTDALILTLRRRPPSEEGIAVASRAGERLLPWEVFVRAPGASMALTLELPDEQFALLASGTLRPAIRIAAPTATRVRGIELFCHSSLGRLLWEIVANGRPLPHRETIPFQVTERGMPLPAEEILDQLAFSLPEGPTLPATQTIDLELERWFAPLTFPGGPHATKERGLRLRYKSAPHDDPTVAERIAQEVFVDGIPLFPEHYLLNHYRPKTQSYTFKERLEIHTVFFEMVTLQNQDGFQLEVEGMETAQALVFASHCGRETLQLPADRKLTGLILERFRHDLLLLLQRLRQRVYLETDNPRLASALCEAIWNRHPLPPLHLLEL